MKITQRSLDSFTNTLKRTNDNMNNIVGSSTNNIKNWFNDYWISPNSRTDAEIVDDIINSYQTKAVSIFNDLNNKIQINVYIHNNNDDNEDKVYYHKRNLIRKKSSIKGDLNSTLPKNYIGRLHDTADIYYPIRKAKETINAIDKELKGAISSCGAISNKEDYRTDLQRIKSDALNSIDAEISRLHSIYSK